MITRRAFAQGLLASSVGVAHVVRAEHFHRRVEVVVEAVRTVQTEGRLDPRLRSGSRNRLSTQRGRAAGNPVWRGRRTRRSRNSKREGARVGLVALRSDHC